MRLIGLICGVSLLAACNKGGGDEPIRLPDGSVLSSSGGEVQLADGSNVKFAITSERYKQWEAARSGISSDVAARFGSLLKPEAPTEKTIARAVSYLETTPARQAITRTGMTVRDFVIMTVALEQEMRVAAARGAGKVPEPSMPAQPLPDSFVTQAPVPPPTPLDTTARRDTVYYPAPAPTPLPAPVPVRPAPRDTMLRDTLLIPPKRDTTRRAPSPPPRDTVRDTVRTPSRDTIPSPPRDTARDTTRTT